MSSIKKILLVSQLCSSHLINKILQTSEIGLVPAGPKFYKLLAEGFAMHRKSCLIETLSTIPVTYKSHRRRFWIFTPEKIENIKYNYVPTLNFPGIRVLLNFIYPFFKIIMWSLYGGRKNKIVICDLLGLSVCLASILACKLTRIKIIAIVTDLPELVVANGNERGKIIHKFYVKILSKLMYSFDSYIFLTEKMNEIVNKYQKPYLVMEGLVDLKMKASVNAIKNKSAKKIIMYAGSLNEKYGIKNMIKAFMKLEDVALLLYIYGKGDMEKELEYYTKLDQRIVFHGLVPNEIVIQKELEATLLINPRPSNEIYTNYSFPSKNLEYMASGTPLVTTLLPGLPNEYQKYVFLIKDESVNGISNSLNKILEKSQEELHYFGGVAKEFVLKNKSNLRQSKRILNFIESSNLV
jgi:glycosyltransferase involved in cell wall biosynthesis